MRGNDLFEEQDGIAVVIAVGVRRFRVDDGLQKLERACLCCQLLRFLLPLLENRRFHGLHLHGLQLDEHVDGGCRLRVLFGMG